MNKIFYIFFLLFVPAPSLSAGIFFEGFFSSFVLTKSLLSENSLAPTKSLVLVKSDLKNLSSLFSKNQTLINSATETIDIKESESVENLFKQTDLNSQKKEIIISSKIFTENILLAEMLSLLLEEKYTFKVIRKFNLGGTQLVFSALRNKEIDVYPEYTGTGYTMILKLSGETQPKKTFKIVKKEFLNKFNLVWSLPLGFENTYTLAVRSSDLRFKKIHRISQLKGKTKSLKLGAGHEFMERQDGFLNFIKKYQLSFQKDQTWTMNQGLMYSALKNKKIDMVMAYSTDGRIKAFDLKTLRDDKSFFPAYEAAYLTRKDFLKQYPMLKKAFKQLEGNITEKEMIFLNNQVDQLKLDSTQIARNFLIKKNLLEDDIKNLKQQSWLDYYISKKEYFFKIFYEHLLLVVVSLFFALWLAIPIGLWASYNNKVEKTVFFIVNTLQTVPSLALLAIFIPFLGIGFLPAVVTLFIYSLLPIIRNTFEAIKNIDRVLISAGAGMGLNIWQVLRYIQIPLAFPMILAGVRTSAVIVVGTATLAAFIGAGGLGDPIFRGIATLNSKLIFLGAVPACLLAIFIDRFLAFLEKLIIPKGLKLEKNIKSIAFK